MLELKLYKLTSCKQCVAGTFAALNRKGILFWSWFPFTSKFCSVSFGDVLPPWQHSICQACTRSPTPYPQSFRTESPQPKLCVISSSGGPVLERRIICGFEDPSPIRGTELAPSLPRKECVGKAGWQRSRALCSPLCNLLKPSKGSWTAVVRHHIDEMVLPGLGSGCAVCDRTGPLLLPLQLLVGWVKGMFPPCHLANFPSHIFCTGSICTQHCSAAGVGDHVLWMAALVAHGESIRGRMMAASLSCCLELWEGALRCLGLGQIWWDFCFGQVVWWEPLA